MAETPNMKSLYTLLVFIVCGLLACKKDSKPAVVVTITEKTSFGVNTYAAIVENPDPATHGFLCSLGASNFKPTYNCTNAVYITNLPSSLAVVGKRITFSSYKDNGQPLLFSSINHAHELEVNSPKEAQ
jgi:hypothetical protein